MKALSTHSFKDNGIISNSRLPVILFIKAIDLPDSTECVETNFKINH